MEKVCYNFNIHNYNEFICVCGIFLSHKKGNLRVGNYHNLKGGNPKMLKKISSLPFKGTPEQEAQLKAVIEANKDDKSMLMHVMQEAQGIYGYLPYEVQVMIAEGMDVPLEKVYGVSTFYAQFSLSPKGEYNISVCLGTACYVKGAQDLVDRISEKLGIGPDECTADGKFSLEACRCIGACGLAPVLTVNDEVYGKLTGDDIPGILEKYMA